MTRLSALPHASAPPAAPMSYRAVMIDDQVWTVRAVALPPRAAELAARKPNAVTNWLTAATTDEKRRIAPIPSDWEGWTDERLAHAIRDAEVMVARAS